MRWRRICVDVSDGGDVLGGSVELYDDSQEGANVVCVASEGEIIGKNPGQLHQHLYDHFRWAQLALLFPPEDEDWPSSFGPTAPLHVLHDPPA